MQHTCAHRHLHTSKLTYPLHPNLQGYIDNTDRGFGYNNLDKLKYEVEGLMAKYEVEPNARCACFRAGMEAICIC